jgi:DNA-binding XRE family transcriptional regulator
MAIPENSTELKMELQYQLSQGQLTLGEATRKMRNITGLNQKEYANKVLGIAPRILMDLELGRGNPTLTTLNKIARPFGYQIGFIKNR